MKHRTFASVAVAATPLVPGGRGHDDAPATGGATASPAMNWSAPHGDTGNAHFTRLDQVNAGKVKQLEAAWEYRSTARCAPARMSPASGPIPPDSQNITSSRPLVSPTAKFAS